MHPLELLISIKITIRVIVIQKKSKVLLSLY